MFPQSPPSPWRLSIYGGQVSVYYRSDEFGEVLVGTVYLHPDGIADLQRRLA